jgi:ApbE superfamily uncharacterized protein (UPF0280 family)
MTSAAAVEEEPVRVLARDLVLVDWGPMTLTVSAWLDGEARPVMAAEAARSALSCLEILADFQQFLKAAARPLPAPRKLPPVVRRAHDAVRAVSSELTPLAAVAGAVADEVAGTAASLGSDRAIVNNGGDIALHLGPGTSALVGIKTMDGGKLAGRLTVGAETGIGGVASSGWDGRSLSPGVADLVTVWAESASLADAAATFLAGSARTDAGESLRVPATDIDPLSDLGARPVTRSVGNLTRAQKAGALARAAAAAERMLSAGIIRGCAVWLQGDLFTLDPEGLLRL